ncbi:hypothetical protein T03_3199 [Trichinella britovi]|uniref:PiggyBac transposable element-derived protein domain-containing protein n=1 Tax=Trichinella britovi TaxID=45882 RepID=A0A0V1CD74_TRIBR|nr:hypothetical protein T03_3199 [Trichinella britovi]
MLTVAAQMFIAVWKQNAAEDLLAKKTTIVGTLRRNKTEVPSELTEAMGREVDLSIFCPLGYRGCRFFTVQTSLILFPESIDSTVDLFGSNKLGFDPTRCNILFTQLVQLFREELQSSLQPDQLPRRGGRSRFQNCFGNYHNLTVDRGFRRITITWNLTFSESGSENQNAVDTT